MTGDDRRSGKNLRRPHQLVAVNGVGGAKKRRLEEEGKLANDGEKMQVPGLVDLLEATDFSHERSVHIVRRRPLARFIGC